MGDLHDTICALSTAAGRAGIAVVRLSGPDTFRLVREIFVPERPFGEQPPARYAVLGSMKLPEGAGELDQVLLTCFPLPKSYTGEDVAEISMHGSPVLVAALLDGLCGLGARLAEPGEFTLRAFLNGRMDLSQAEAVRDVIEARTVYQAQVASRQRSGELSRHLAPVKKLLIDIIVELESAVEFVEENLPLESREAVADKLDTVQRNLRKWTHTFRRGRLIREGFSMAIIGRPNVGKSSLFNALLAQDRSIVAELPGTTRDLVSEDTNIEGIPVRLLDTAGLRPSDDRIEQLGMDRSNRAMAEADALLLVVDMSQPIMPEDEQLKDRMGGLSCILVFNKSDLPCAWSAKEMEAFAGNWLPVEVSARTGAEIEKLQKSIFSHLFGNEGAERESFLVTNLRHCRCMEGALDGLNRAAESLRNGLSEEFALVGLHDALRKLGEITGQTSVEDLLGEIFSRFCVGK